MDGLVEQYTEYYIQRKFGNSDTWYTCSGIYFNRNSAIKDFNEMKLIEPDVRLIKHLHSTFVDLEE